MATNCSDFVDSIDGLLRAAGYVIHNGNAETGETVTDESGADWWFTWGTPQMSEYECGPTCSGSLEALQSAALHWFENARVPMHTSTKVEAQTAPTVVVDFSGGAIHAIRSDAPARLIVLDFDPEGCDPEGVRTIDGKTCYVVSHVNAAGGGDIDPTYCAAIVAEIDAEPAGPFYVVIDHEKTAAECATLEAARTEGRALADAEPIPCTFSIQDANGRHVEDIARTDGRTLPELMQAFDAAHRK